MSQYHFLKGMKSTFEIFPEKRTNNFEKLFIDDDKEAIKQDWLAVGKDIKFSLDKYQDEENRA